MKVIIEATQEEFDLKRAVLANKIAGVTPFTPRRGRFKAQKEMLNHYDEKFKELLSAIRTDVDEIIKES